MGIIKAAIGAIGGALADTWLEVIEPDNMGKYTVITPGRLVTNGRSSNTKGTANVVSNGSKIHVFENQMMILVDNGKVVDYTCEPGLYEVSMSSTPSLFNGQFKDTLKESFSRIKYGGIPSNTQRVFFINLKEIKDIKFGTPNPVQYYDNFYDAELFMRLHGTYSVKITDPFKFYAEVIPGETITNNESLEFTGEFIRQYNDEFVGELGAAFNQYSADGNRISHITSKAREMRKYMADALDEEWKQLRGFEIVSVAITPPSYSDQSQKIIDQRAEMGTKVSYLRDGANQQAYVAANISEGIKAAGSNTGGATNAFMGMGFGQMMGGNMMGGYMQNPQYGQANGPAQAYGQQPQQPQQQYGQQAPRQQAPQQGAPAQGGWTCECGTQNTGNFCQNCGSKKPEAPKKRFCQNCGAELSAGAKFCPECGSKA